MSQADARSYRARGVQRLLEPASIAIIGFSMKQGSGGRNCLESLKLGNYTGQIHLVGRSGGEFEGRPVLTDISLLPKGVELAVLNVPAAAVRAAVALCIRQQIPAGVVFASGFAELGDAARAEQDEISLMACEGGLALVGPNCMGYTNYRSGLTVSFMPARVTEKLAADSGPGVAIVTQSGGLMAHFHQSLTARRIPIAYRVSTGNEVSLGLADFIQNLANDPEVRIVVAYAEHIREPREFLAAVAMLRAKGKVLVLLHTGRGEDARNAAASHTGALASDYQAMLVHVTQAGALVVDTMEELLDTTELLFRFPVPPTEGLGVMTTSGAVCALAHDYCEEVGIVIAKLSKATQAKLATRLPDYVVAQNPLDLTTQVMWDDNLIGDCAAALVADPAVGSVCMVIPAGDGKRGLTWLGSVLPQTSQPKPVILTLLGDQHPLAPEYEAMAREAGVILSRSAERSMRTLARVTRFGKADSRRTIAAPPQQYVALPFLPANTVIPEWQGKQIIAAAGIKIPAGSLALTVEEALFIAGGIGFPVVAKVQASELAHKTEVGGVILGIQDADGVRNAWQTLNDRMASACNGVKLEGILIETMSSNGLELMVGAKRDAKWGPVLMVGLGGVWVEVLKDVRLLTAGMDREAITTELRLLKASRLLDGYRGTPRLDAGAVVDVVTAVGQLMLSHPAIQEIDINPLMVMPSGAVALDALVSTVVPAGKATHIGEADVCESDT
jgi:acyl-CoA synthetase (NDP forming)